MYWLRMFGLIKFLILIATYTIIGLGIAIIIYNKKLLDNINNQNIEEININKNKLKYLLLSLFILSILTYIGIILYSYIYRKRSLDIQSEQRNILNYSIPISVFLIVIFTSIFIYLNIAINSTQKSVLELLYGIIPIIMIIHICIYWYLVINLQYVTRQLYNRIYYPEDFISTPTVVRNISRSSMSTTPNFNYYSNNENDF